MAHFLKYFLVPEVRRRVDTGEIAPQLLPFYVRQFRFLQIPGKTHLELNDEVRVTANAKLKTSRPINAGELLTADDIDLDETYLEPPTLDGKRAAFFLCRSSFLNFITLFDFTPNAPPERTSSDPESRMRYPFADFAVSDNLLKVMRPIERFKQLADANWPPGPAYYPNVLWQIHNHPDALHEPGFADVVAKAYGETYLRRQLGFWTETNFFGSRIQYVKKSIDAFIAGDYVSTIYVLVPHLEGIVKDYLASAGLTPKYRFESCVRDLKTLVLSRSALMFPVEILERIFAFIETGSFLTETTKIQDPAREVTRHGIAHGVFVGFENRDIALKYLILLDALAYVLLHDKLLTATL
jgi:hypothetical protein